MKDEHLKLTPYVLTVVVIVLAIASESVYFGNFEYQFRTKRFNRILWAKERIMENCLEGMKPILARGETHGSKSENSLFSEAQRNNITLLEYISGKLVYWSNNDFEVPGILVDSIYKKQLVFLQNGWFLTKSVQAGNEIIVALMRIRSDYGLDNDIVRNGFIKDFRIPVNTRFNRIDEKTDYKVFTKNGSFLFSLLYPKEKGKTYFIFVPLLLWGITFFLIICVTLYLVKYITVRSGKIPALIILFLIMAGVYLVILLAKQPGSLFQTELFSPYHYTMNPFIPSLGHLSILSILLSVIAYVFFRNLNIYQPLKSLDRSGYISLTLLLIPCALLFSLYQVIFSHLIFNSNINFETFKVLDLNLFSLAGFITIALLFGIPFLYTLKIFQTLSQLNFKILLSSVVSVLPVFLLFFLNDPVILVTIVVFFIIVTILTWLLIRKEAGVFNRTVIFSLVFGFYSLFLITYLSEKKTEEKVKIQLITFSTENDPTAEHMLLDMWPIISADSTLRKMMDVSFFRKEDFDKISDYLNEKYFNGYWNNFNLNLVLCSQNDSLRVGDRNLFYTNCFYFFGKRILTNGHMLTGTGFYFIDSRQGRSEYLGRMYFVFPDARTNGLFIDLYSDINVFQPGYSELLLDKKYHSYANLKDYSFAKYINGEIVLRTGDFPYNKTDAEYIEKAVDYSFFRANSLKHALYRNGNVTVVISWPVISAQNLIISFAYLFSFIFIFTNLIIFFSGSSLRIATSGLNFRQKMQLSFISILLFSFSLIGFVIASIAVRQYQARHYDNIKEKLNSVYIELENRIGSEKNLSSELRSSTTNDLEEYLVTLSNIFNTDINLFDLKGNLIATSRPEIFSRNLISKRMDNIASINLENLKKSEYFQKEKIGNLEYVSAYIPFYNTDNELIAYLNLPYFRMQSVLAKEISNMIVTVINFTLLLIVIAMSLAVFISGRLTSPLAMLSSRLATVELGKKSEHLSYNGNDEVGELVRQYNQMVDELDESAQKLADSEREYAWREMAKQVAHEIKNPLTPMKLNVQQLLKSWVDGIPGFEKKLERFTKNQIEYIDSLSSIASAFSSFAKIPEANPGAVDLLEQIKTTLELFKSSDNISFRIGWPHTGKIYIYADKEQVNSIFSNLIKNGIQSIPPGKVGIIKVNLESDDEKVIVSVSDNGTGIPEPLKKKMFTPNFTTKSSGTGLGLSIVKRYVENASGRIWFESESGKGSVFYVEFPCIKPGENPVIQ